MLENSIRFYHRHICDRKPPGSDFLSFSRLQTVHLCWIIDWYWAIYLIFQYSVGQIDSESLCNLTAFSGHFETFRHTQHALVSTQSFEGWTNHYTFWCTFRLLRSIWTWNLINQPSKKKNRTKKCAIVFRTKTMKCKYIKKQQKSNGQIKIVGNKTQLWIQFIG